jgi:hypothetical protein
MRSLDLSRHTLHISIAAAMLAGCGGSQPPIGAPGAMPQSRTVATRAQHGGSWMSPNTQAENLLYVTDASYVTVYSYPQGKLVGVLTGFESAVGECADNKGDVFITNPSVTYGGYPDVLEYAHGGSQPIAMLATTHLYPVGCSVDPTTGNVAVSGGDSHGVGIVNIFQGAQGKPILFQAPQMVLTQFCGYDDQGDLFVNGLKHFSGGAAFAELPKGGQKFVSIKLNAVYDWQSGVQWDGKYLAVGGYIPPGVTNATPVIYRFAIKGNHGTRVGTTVLGKPAFLTSFDFFITGGTAIVPNWYNAPKRPYNVLLYDYPKGGLPIKILTRHLSHPRGAVVSFASADR